MAKAVTDWTPQDVEDFLIGLHLDGLAPGFRQNAVNGKDLLQFTDDDLSQELNCTNLQARNNHNNNVVYRNRRIDPPDTPFPLSSNL